MEYIIIKNLDTATESELKAAIDCNNRIYRLMSSEISKLKRVAATVKNASSIPDSEQEEVTPLREEPSTRDEDFENEVEFYYSAVKELTKENLESEMLKALPSRMNYQYERIMLRIKAEIMRNIKDIKDFLKEEGISLEDAQDFKDELLLEVEKLKLVCKQLESQEEMTASETTTTENNLIFVPTTGGNIRVLEEIERVDYDYYERFNGLFQSIKNGTFKNVQRFSRNSDLAGLCEVKDFKTRVIFTRLNQNSYAIISAFIKKSDNDKGYRNMLSSRYSDYLSTEPRLIANLDNEEFMTLQKQYETELFEKLSPSEKTTPKVNTKVGE